MSDSNIVSGRVLIPHSAVREGLASPIQGLPSNIRVVVYFPHEIYQLLEVILGGPPNLTNVLLPSSSVEVQVNDSTTGVRYRGRISDIQPVHDHLPDAMLYDDRSSPRDPIITSQFHENTYQPYQAPTGMRSNWKDTTATHDTGSFGFESAPRVLNNHATLQVRVRHPLLPPELPSTIQPVFLPSVSSSSNTVAPPSNRLHLLGGGATTPEQQIQHPDSYGFESAPGDLKDHAGIHHPSLPPELPSTMQPILPSLPPELPSTMQPVLPSFSPELPSIMQPILPSISSSTTVAFPFSAQSSFLDGSATLPEVPFADRQVSHHSEYGMQSAHGHQIQQPGCPRAYMVDGLPVDEEDLVDGNTDNGCINVHACDREDSPCGLWVKADRRSIIRHGQRWHEDARFGLDKIITCPWSGCNKQMRANAVPRHTLSAHFGVTWICRGPGCSKVFSRHDAFKAHADKRGCLGATVNYDANTRVVNTKNVLSHYG